MKKAIFIVVLLITTISFSQEAAQAQEPYENTSNNELKINMTNLIAFKWADVTYEYLLNEESSIGAGLLFTLDKDNDLDIDEYRTFSLTPFYRHFFGKKYAKGFFVEAFGMLHSGEDYEYIYDHMFDETRVDESYTDFAVGISVGGKFVTKRGFIAEIYGGIGRDLLGNSDIEVVGRGGVSIGYRF